MTLYNIIVGMSKLFNRVIRDIYVNDKGSMFEVVLTYKDDGHDDIHINNLCIRPMFHNLNITKSYIMKRGILDYYNLRNTFNYNEITMILENWNSFEYDIKKDLIKSIFTLAKLSYTN